ncbi:MAG: PEP-CTERM sorting domain-containing protein [Aquabacterium sp.]
MQTLRSLALAASLAAGPLSAQAALIDRGGGMIYDTTLNLTWLADWNYAKTSGYHADGAMNWASANDWANNLVYGGYDDWRLPSALNADASGPCGPAFGCDGSEMGHMFYNNWGVTAGFDFFTGSNAANLAMFKNIQAGPYWYGTEYAPDRDSAWFFYTASSGGFQTYVPKWVPIFAVAVRVGEVPEPQTYALMLIGLGALALARRRRAR